MGIVVKYSAFINGEFIGAVEGDLPIWTINWIRVCYFEILNFKVNFGIRDMHISMYTKMDRYMLK